jgi:hypothetical protein
MRTYGIVLIAIVGYVLYSIDVPARSTFASSSDGIQMRFRFSGRGFGSGNGICTLGPGTGCEGMAWTGDESGFSLGTIQKSVAVEGADFELIFSFSYAAENGRPYLDGVLYSLDVVSDRSVVTGRRRTLHEPIDFGEPHTLTFTSERTGKSIELEYALEGGSMESQITFGRSTLALKSFDRSDRATSSTAEVHGLVGKSGDQDDPKNTVSEPQYFSFSFSPDHSRSARRDTAVNYDVTISFDPPLVRDQFPMRSRLKLDRMYWIDTLHVPGDNINPHWGTGFSYTKDVEIVPGKVLKLVFPPEPKLKLPFQIEDTVVITP